MYPLDPNDTTDDLVLTVDELEDAYAEALADEVDAKSLSNLWERIKMMKAGRQASFCGIKTCKENQ